MSAHSAATEVVGVPTPGEARDAAEWISGFWWLYLVVGILWIVASLVILQFDKASLTTIGIIIGVMFAVSGIEQLALAFLADSLRWLWGLFGALFLVAAILCFIKPVDTFVALANMLGFLFLCVGVWWTIRAFLVKAVDSVWWLGLVAGIMMIALAFILSGDLFIKRAYALVVFAGIWALLQGIADVVRAFQVRSLRKLL
jgi:uncharacterized membrane protein HdeD (DUF308 family)